MSDNNTHSDRRDELFRLAFEGAGYANLIADMAGTIVAVNQFACLLFGYASDELIGESVDLLIPRARRAAHAEQRASYSQSPRMRPMGSGRDLVARAKDGGEVPVEISLSSVTWNGEMLVMASIVDISLRKEAERKLIQMSEELHATNERLDRLAATDPLTGLRNRRGLERELYTAVAEVARGGSGAMALLIDCDDFKSINDRLGYAAGDTVLKAVGASIENTIRPGDCLARVGGDEFLVMLPETCESEALAVAELIRLRLASQPLPVDDGKSSTTVSIGVAPIPSNIASFEELLGCCEELLKRSKKTGKNRVSGNGDTENADSITASLVAGTGLVAFSQPIVAISTGEAVGCEMLSRWSEGALRMPVDFFAAARERNILTAVDLACLRACAKATKRLEPGMVAHLNILPSTLLATPVEQLLELLGVGNGGPQLALEVSEQQFVGDPSCLRTIVEQIKAAGVHLAIDDVGYGRSSLETLIVLEADIVKVDRRYIAGCATSPGLRSSLARLLRVVDALGARTVAEGVETEEEGAVLRDLGVDYAQGYYYGRPSPASVIE